MLRSIARIFSPVLKSSSFAQIFLDYFARKIVICKIIGGGGGLEWLHPHVPSPPRTCMVLV